MKITNPELKVVRFDNEDVIATSFFYLSAADYTATFGTAFDQDHEYVELIGAMTSYDSSQNAWLVNANTANPNPQYASTLSNLKDIAAGGGYIYPQELGGIGIPVSPGLFQATKEGYDAYIYNGNIYTKGASYFDLYSNQ